MAPRNKPPVKAAELEASSRVSSDDEPRDDAEQALDDLDDDDHPDDLPAAAEGAAELVASEPPPRLPSPTLPTAPVVQMAVPYQPRVIYSPARDRHMSEMGPVATRNFTAVIRGTRVDVKMGAPRKRIPREVIELMERSGVSFGIAAPPEGAGGNVIPRGRGEPPRARRTERRGDEPERGFKKVQSIASQPGF